jgi:hypothetical protein
VWYNGGMKSIVNLISRIQGARFAKAWAKGQTPKADRLLVSYCSWRRRLPVMSDGNHWGNHWLSSKKPFRATQGL